MQQNTPQLVNEPAKLDQLLTFNETRSLLCKSRSGFYKILAKDPTFPKPLKDGKARQARAYFSASEVAAWQQAKLKERGTA